MLAAVSPASITSAGRIVALAPAHLAGTDAFDTLEETPERRFAAITHHLGDRRHRDAAAFQQPSRFGRAPLREVLARRLADGLREQLGEWGAVAGSAQIGRARVCTPVTNAHLLCRPPPETPNK